MPAKNPRINVAMERQLYAAVHDLAEGQGVSMSNVVRDLIREALELREDAALAALAERRERVGGKRLTHEEVWGRRP
jgi:Arc/MetJ-type ribon-helix-helix transcriptional regulator